MATIFAFDAYHHVLGTTADVQGPCQCLSMITCSWPGTAVPPLTAKRGRTAEGSPACWNGIGNGPRACYELGEGVHLVDDDHRQTLPL